MSVDEALTEADASVRYGDSLGPSYTAVLAAEVRRLQREQARLGPYPLEAVFKVEGEPEQLMFRRPDGGLVVLTRERES